MNPSRVVVGEVRGNEIIPMLNAMSQGNDGSMCTIHANSSDGVFDRVAAYCIQAPEHLDREATNLLLANAVDLVFIDQRQAQAASTDRVGPRVVAQTSNLVVSTKCSDPTAMKGAICAGARCGREPRRAVPSAGVNSVEWSGSVLLMIVVLVAACGAMFAGGLFVRALVGTCLRQQPATRPNRRFLPIVSIALGSAPRLLPSLVSSSP
jgi:hypothetical protein